MLNGSPRIARRSCATSWPRTSASTIATTARNGTLLPKRNGGSKNFGSELSEHSEPKSSLTKRTAATGGLLYIANVRDGSNPDLGAFPLHVRSGGPKGPPDANQT